MALCLRISLQSAQLAGLAGVLISVPAAAQDPPADRLAQAQAGDPIAQAQALFDDIAAMRWQAAAERFHPAAAERIRRTHIETARSMEAARQQEPWFDPAMPEAVRDWLEQQRRQHEELYRPEDELVPPSELQDIDAFAAVARILARTDMRTRMLLALERRGEALPPGTRIEDQPFFRNVAFAAAYESDSVAYVLYRTSHGDHPIDMESPLEIATLRHTVDGWRVWSTGGHDVFGTSFVFAHMNTWADMAERFEQLKDRVFTWPPDGPAELTVRIIGFTPGEAPRGIELEGVQADGTTSRFVIPYAALEPLYTYLQPWLYVR